MRVLDPQEHLRLLEAEVQAFEQALREVDPALPVTHCAPWTVADVAGHLGGIHEWSQVAAGQGRRDHRPAPAPADPTALPAWYAARGRSLVDTLSSLDAGTACWTLAPPATTAFWRRRQLHETVVHRWDVLRAAGREPRIAADLAADGVDEVAGTMFPRQVARGRTTDPGRAVLLAATDTGGTALIGTGEPAGSVAAPAERLLLLLWRRLRLEEPDFSLDGDAPAVIAALDRPLTP